MRDTTEKLIRYKNSRDVLFVFGAGASISEGAPLQRDILRFIYESTDEKLISSDAANLVRRFLQDNFDVSNNLIVARK